LIWFKNIPNSEARELCLSEGTEGIIEEFEDTAGWCIGAEGGRCMFELPPLDVPAIWLMLGLETGGVVLWLEAAVRECFSTVAGISWCACNTGSLVVPGPENWNKYNRKVI
jgi:hypothetical protein